MKLEKIIKLIKKKLGPYEESDEENNKLIFGNLNNEVNQIYFCWRLTQEILKELKPDKNILIICHEPIFYNVKCFLTPKIDSSSIKSNQEKSELISSSGVNIARFHLSLDSSPYGTTSTLIKKFNLIEKKKFDYFSICELDKSTKVIDFINKIRSELEIPFIEVIGETNKEIKRVLVIAGGGANKEFLSFALANKCDALISGDSYMESKYFAYENDILLIDIGHQSSEMPGIENITKTIKQDLKNEDIRVDFIKNKEVSKFFNKR